MGAVEGIQAQQTPYVFVSYASVDRERVLPMVAALERAGVPVWIDRVGIGGGENYAAEINDAIQRCAALVLMCSEQSLASRNVKQELALAWEHERPYVPLMLEQVGIPGDVKYWLTAAQWIEVLDKPASQWLAQLLAALAPFGVIADGAEEPASDLAGRDRELAQLREALAVMHAGQGGLVLIGGEAGIGKTALADVLCREAARQGALVLTGRCFDLAETPPYGSWIDLCARYPSSPALPKLPAAFAERGTVGSVSSQMALFVQVQDFLTALTLQRPVVLLLDDLHWADPASLDLLRFLLPTLASAPLLILTTYRSDELAARHPLYQALPQLARGDATTRLDLNRLTDEAVQSLVALRYTLPADDEARLVAYLQARAEGNALFLGELLRSLEEAETLRPAEDGWQLGELTATTVPALLRQVIDGRAARLDAESRRLLGIAAVIGHEAPLAIWAAVGDVSEDALLPVVEQGLETHLLVEAASADAVRFAHALIREALYEGIPGIRRRRIHRQIGETLAAHANADPDAVAYHFLQDGDVRCVEWLVRAGDRAQGASAWLTAAERFQAAATFLEVRGIEENQRGWLLLRIAYLCRYAFSERAFAHLEDAGQIASAVGDRALAACVVTQRGFLVCANGDYGRGLDDIRAGVELFDRLMEQARARLAQRDAMRAAGLDQYGYLALQLALAGAFSEAHSAVERILAPSAGAEHLHPPSDNDRTHASYGRAFLYTALGRPADAQRAFAASRAGYLAAGDYYLAGMTAMQELVCLLRYQPDARAERQRLATEAGAVWRQAAGAFDELAPRLVQAPLLFIEGHWDEAHALAHAVHERSQGRWTYVALATNILGQLARYRGHTALAWSLVPEGVPDGPDTLPGTTRYADSLVLQELAAALATDAGDLMTAQAWLEAHDRWITWGSAVLGQAEGHLGWAAYHRAAGDTERAREHVEHALVAASEPRQPFALLAAYRLRGELDTEAGDVEEAERHLQAALTLADACGAPFERALTQLALAGLRAATGDAQRAVALLDEARTSFGALGAQPALARVEALAAQLVAAPAPRRPTYPAGLSAREVEVLRLLAAGATNAEIAEQLFLGVRTVETHIRAIYNKLGHTSRTAATRFAIEHDLT
jgi:DNA-binding CsgD family transcriptional regulator